MFFMDFHGETHLPPMTMEWSFTLKIIQFG
jgi:hypothetical protein